MRNRRLSKAFTLVEILIVVVILGILAAIVVPQFTNATQDAQTGNLRAQIKSLSNQIELYRARRNSYPALATNGWQDLISGGYIKAAPKNPYNGLSTVVAGTRADDGAGNYSIDGAAGSGWVWDETTGYLSACYFNELTDTIDPANP